MGASRKAAARNPTSKALSSLVAGDAPSDPLASSLGGSGGEGEDGRGGNRTTPAEFERTLRRDAVLRKMHALLALPASPVSAATEGAAESSVEPPLHLFRAFSVSIRSPDAADFRALADGTRVTFAGELLEGSEGAGATEGTDSGVCLRVRNDGFCLKWPSGSTAVEACMDDVSTSGLQRYLEAASEVNTSASSTSSLRKSPLIPALLQGRPSSSHRLFRLIASTKELVGRGKGVSVTLDGLASGSVSSNTGTTVMCILDSGAAFHTDLKGAVVRKWDRTGAVVWQGRGFDPLTLNSLGSEAASGVTRPSSAASVQSVAAATETEPRVSGPTAGPVQQEEPIHPSIRAARAAMAAAMAAAEASNAAMAALTSRLQAKEAARADEEGDAVAAPENGTGSPKSTRAGEPAAKSASAAAPALSLGGTTSISTGTTPIDADSRNVRSAVYELVLGCRREDMTDSQRTALESGSNALYFSTSAHAAYFLSPSFAIVYDIAALRTTLFIGVKGYCYCVACK
jgi:hypothetical protein